ncbi:hypothetical protein BSL78_14212 [Apostichopus japonicus]|uniref:Uncharacterized protein n=1 Tax=Stichopus japonicus TaxID=307972 RepID=A0A2G8KLT3_STIJA|nr:hypothetical protein BSL78_14212 [Apostichopus japonicus]
MDDDMMISEFMKESVADPRFQNLMMLVKTRSLRGRSREDVRSELRALLDECMKKVLSRHGFTVPDGISSAVAANLTAVTSASQPTGQRKVVVKSDKLSPPSADGEKSSPATTTFKDVIEQNDRHVSGRNVAPVSQRRNTNVYKELLASIKESKKQAQKESLGSNRKGTEFTEVKMKKIFRYMAYKNEDSDSEEEEDLAKFANPFARYRMKLKSPYSHGQTAKTKMDEMPVLNLGSYMQGPVKSSDQERCPDTANTTSGCNLDQPSEDGMDNSSSPLAETFSQHSDDKKTASMDTVMDETDSERCSDLSSEKSVHTLNDSVPPSTPDVKLADLEQERIVGEVSPTPSDEEVTPETDQEWCPDAANNASVYNLDQPLEDGMDNSSSLSIDSSNQLSDDKKTASKDTAVDEIASERCSDLSSEKSVHNLDDSVPLKTTDVKPADVVEVGSVGEVRSTPSDEEVTPGTDLEWCPDAANNASVYNLDQLPEDGMDTVVDKIASERCSDLSSEESVHNLDDSVPFKTIDVKPADLAQRIVEEVSPTLSDEEVTPDTDLERCPNAAYNASGYNLDQLSEDGMDNSSSSSDDTSCNKTLKEELLESCIAKGMRRQFISDRYLDALVNLHKTKAELQARKPEPRVRIEKPVHLDTDLMYSVRQSLKRSLPKVAGKNNLSALMMMADGMFQEMSLDRGLDELAWPYDPLAELRESGLALVDYMEPTSNVRSQLVTKSAESQLPMVNTSTPSGTENVNISKEDNKHTHMPSSIIGESKPVIDRFLQENPTAHENRGQLKSPRSHCQLAKTCVGETPVLNLGLNMQDEGIVKSSDDLERYQGATNTSSGYNLDQLSKDGMDDSSSPFADTSYQLLDDKKTASMDTVVEETASESCSDLTSEKSVHNLEDSVPLKTTDVKPADLEQRGIVGEVRPTPSDEDVTPETDQEWCPDAAKNASGYNLDQLSEDGMDNSSSPFADTSYQLSDDKKTASMDTIVDEIASERCSDLSSEESVHNLNDSVPLITIDVKPADVVEGRSVEKVSLTLSDEEVTPETDLKWCPDAANDASVYNLDQTLEDGMDNSSSLLAGTSYQLSDDKKTASKDTIVDEIASERCLDLSSEKSVHNLNYSIPFKTTDVKPADFKQGGSVGEVNPTPSDEEVTPETDLEWCPDAANNASVYNLDQLSEDRMDNSSSIFC